MIFGQLTKPSLDCRLLYTTKNNSNSCEVDKFVIYLLKDAYFKMKSTPSTGSCENLWSVLHVYIKYYVFVIFELRISSSHKYIVWYM